MIPKVCKEDHRLSTNVWQLHCSFVEDTCYWIITVSIQSTNLWYPVGNLSSIPFRLALV